MQGHGGCHREQVGWDIRSWPTVCVQPGIVFGIFARFAPLVSTGRRDDGLMLRLPAAGLLKNHGTSSALMLLVIGH
jgi:hypothetical protein